MKLFTRIILLFFAIFFSASPAQGQLVAGFTAAPTSGCPPLLVNFTNTSTGATSYRWDLDNGDHSFTLTSVSSTYTVTGTFTATLTAFNSSGDSSKHTVEITVYPLPIVSFTAMDTAVCPFAPITFTSSTIGGVPGPITYAWNFGDGSGNSGNPVSHSYSHPGYYNITLTATNAEGCNADTTVPHYIDIYTPPASVFSAATTSFCTLPGDADFTTSVSGTGPYSYAWSFGDGSAPGSGATVTHPYTAYGDYTVTLIVTDGHGCKDTVTEPDYIFVGTVAGSFAYPDTACINSLVTFTNTIGTHTSTSWSYGDGGHGTSDDGSNTYHTAGLYTVTMVVADGPCTDTVSHTIYIRPGPTASFTQNPLHPCPPPVPITFTATVPTGSTVTWLYGDGTLPGSGTTVTHTYSSPGVDTIKMIVDDGVTGCKDTIIRIDTLYNILYFTALDSPRIGCAPLTVYFSTQIFTSEPIPTYVHAYPYGMASFSWTFGDGGSSADSTPSHTYTVPGTYWAHVTAVTANGCTVTDSVEVFVGAPPVVTFSATPTHVCYNHPVTYVVTVVSGPVDYVLWQFGDGASDSTGGLTYTYRDIIPGVFSVTVTPYYNGCPGAPYVLTDYITVDSPKAIPSYTVECTPHNTVDFADSSMGDDSHVWVFGDGYTSTAANPVHVYSAPAIYYGLLATYNIRSGCRDTADFTINLQEVVPGFTADTAICKYDSTTFRTTFTAGGNAYEWFFYGSLEPAVGGAPDSIRIGYNVSGIFSVMLVIKDGNGCYDTATKTNYIHVGKPVPNFTASPATGCWPLTVTFTDHSTDIAGSTPFSSYAWAFGDGAVSTVTTPTVSHTYTVAGSDVITEVVTDNIGCKDTVSLPLVTVYRPTASFTASNLHPCPGADFTFTNTTTGTVATSFWIFGDDSTSSATNPIHFYADTGTYTVKLVVTDSHGCSDTAVRAAYIHVTKPHAAFNMSDSFSICPPLSVSFTNTSTGADSYYWDLGTGVSYLTNPSNYYTSIGLDTITLVAKNLYGCTDTAIGHVSIYGYSGGFSYNTDSGCSPLTVFFTANTSNVPNIVWDFSDGTTSSLSFKDTVTHVYTTPGAYVPRLILSDNTGCKNSSTGLDTIKVDGITAGFTTIPNPICQSGTVNFKDTSKSYWALPASWLWTFTNGDTSTLSNPVYTYSATGTYPVTLFVTDSWGCTSTLNQDVYVYPPAHITASADTTVCVGDKATLTGYGGVSYTWEPSATVSCSPCNPTKAGPTVVTTYTVTGTDEHGCINSDTVTVFLKDKTITAASGDTQACYGVVVPLFDSGATKYTWIPATGLNASNIADPLASPPTTTSYEVIAQLGSCVPDTNYVLVVVHPLPTVNAGPDQYLVAGSQAQLQATGSLIAAYAWSDKSTLSCDSCSNPVASMSVSTTYFVDVTSAFGCKNSDSVSIKLFCDQSQIFMPNTFTPNNDGTNDVFYPRGKGVSIVKSFRIYNRWGELLFERNGFNLNDKASGWDGTYKGDIPHPDVYVWVLDAICDTGEPINLKGDVTIIR